MNVTREEFRSQWTNPTDVLSLLLIIGGDIVRTAIAQLVGNSLHFPWKRGLATRIWIAPVAFSFGWVSYSFYNLLAVAGDLQLMPACDHPCFAVNCGTAFARETKSWVLGRLLRDHEIRNEVDPRREEVGGRRESIRIDIFKLRPRSQSPTPSRDKVWWMGWAVIVFQLLIAMVPWIIYGDWGVFLIAICGTVLAACTCAMPQWAQEKWTSRLLEVKKQKVVCLTRGNGHLHIMVVIAGAGCYDLEAFAVHESVPRFETRCMSLVLAMLWTLFLICVSGLEDHTWFLIGIGAIGMLQNAYAAGTSRDPAASDFRMIPFDRCPTIIGRRQSYKDDEDAEVDLDQAMNDLAEHLAWASTESTTTMDRDLKMPDWLHPLEPDNGSQPASGGTRKTTSSEFSKKGRVVYAPNVHGALMELEKWVPTAGLAMVQIFFPGGLRYEDEAIRDNIHKKFWRKAYHTRSVRKKAEEKRREVELQVPPKEV